MSHILCFHFSPHLCGCVAAKRPSSVSSLSGIVSRMASSGGTSRGSCTSVNTVCSDSDRGASLSSSTSSASLQDGHSSSSSSSLPSGAVPAYPSLPQRNGSDISLDLTPLSGLASSSSSSTALPKLSRLQRVLLEIVETEQAYVRDLKSIVEVWVLIHTLLIFSSLKWNINITHMLSFRQNQTLSGELYIFSRPFLFPSCTCLRHCFTEV